MLRPRSLRPALAAVALKAAALAAAAAMTASTGLAPAPAVLSHAAAATPAPPDEASPLAVTLDSLSPGVIPASGAIRITGSVTNRSEDPWSTIKLYPFLGDTPMTTAAELAAAAEVPAVDVVGDRITSIGDTVDELGPGDSAPFSIRLPRSAVAATERGVYWFGVHALGQGPEGRDTNADGRARTFLPLVPARTRGQVETAVVIPLRRSLVREPDGSMADVEGWVRALGADGGLSSLLDLADAAGDRDVTWLVDPALVDAVTRLAAGNPPRSLAPTVEPEPGSPSDEPGPGFSPGAGTSSSPAGGGPSDDPDGSEEGSGTESPRPEHEPTAAEEVAAELATAWLGRLSEAIESDEVLALPYGDLDVAAATAHEPDLLERTRARTAEATSAWDVTTSPASASPSGFLDADSIRLLGREETVLVTDRMFGDDPPGVATAAGRRLVVTSSGAASGGPGPDDPLATVALRQRILSEAAVRLLNPGRKPLVVQLPAGWTPRSTTDFFDGLDRDWLELTTVADAADRQGTPVELDDLAYPGRQERRRLDPAAFDSAAELVDAGQVLQHVLRDNTAVAGDVADEALASLSYSARGRPVAARLAVEASTRWVEGRLAGITIEAPRGVALSSANGRFGATVANTLDEPVEVSIQAVTDDPSAISIEGPETVQVAARSQASVLLDATTRKPGVHKVTLVLTDHTDDPADEPTPLGSTEELPIRSIQASAVIWVILGAGALLLFGAIVVRLVRRVRRARRDEAVS